MSRSIHTPLCVSLLAIALLAVVGCTTAPPESGTPESYTGVRLQTVGLYRGINVNGCYVPIDQHQLPVGQRNRFMAYMEVEGYQPEPTGDGQYEVNLELRAWLYDSTGHELMWEQQPVVASDVSRDGWELFFVVLPIDLPADLSPGSYLLKLHVGDVANGSADQRTLRDIQLVADPRLTNGHYDGNPITLLRRSTAP